MQDSIKQAQGQNGEVMIRSGPEGGLMLISRSILAGLVGRKQL